MKDQDGREILSIIIGNIRKMDMGVNFTGVSITAEHVSKIVDYYILVENVVAKNLKMGMKIRLTMTEVLI